MEQQLDSLLQVTNLSSPPRKEKKKQRFGPEGQPLDKSYDSMGSNEKDPVHYEFESDNEPPHDEIGDLLTVIKKGQVTKTILEVGEGLGKPGRPYEVTVSLKGYFIERDQTFIDVPEIRFTLGDERVPYGLWKGIEHMRRNEKSLIMIKPKWAYAREEGQGILVYPDGWDTEERKEILRIRRIYYEVKLLDWSVKHDLDGDGLIIKTIHNKGIGYDRPFDFDEITIALKIYQQEIYHEQESISLLMTDKNILTPTLKKILQTMKQDEKVTCRVHPEYFFEKDQLVVQKYGIKNDKFLFYDIEMLKLVRVEDIYKDNSSFLKTLVKGEGTASPYSDCQVLLKVRIEVDGVRVFEHPRFDDLSEIEVGIDCAKYDLEEYHLPSIIRRILKTTKMNEVFQIKTTRRNKIIPFFKDPNGVFNDEILQSFKNEIVFTVSLVAFEQKDYLFKLLIHEKLERLTFLKRVATDFFKSSLFNKALKIYSKILSLYRTKDAKNNFQKEDETQEEYIKMSQELIVIHKAVITNICVIHSKNKAWKDVLRYAIEGLEIDPKYTKALYHKGRSQIELTDYKDAVETLSIAFKLDPDNQDIKKEYIRADTMLKKHHNTETKMFQKMFQQSQ